MKRVLDASAVLAYLHQEPGWEIVRADMESACIGAVNWSEVAQKVARKGLDVETVRGLLTDIGLDIVPFLAVHAEIAAHLWQKTRQHGLSLADRACLALAVDTGLGVLTADRVWAELALGIEIQVLR